MWKTWRKKLGVKIDSKFSFDKHIKTCKKVVTPYMTIEKKKVFMNFFFQLSV